MCFRRFVGRGCGMKKSYEIDMIHGPLLSRMILFAVPLMLSGILQLLFNAADIIVVGRFSGSQALAAVGSTSSLINLLVNVFMGLSIGANVLTARYMGARDERELHDTVHTSITLSLISGVALIFIGVLLARPLLELIGTPEDVIDQATLYMQIYFVGMPATMLYNFGSAILRAVGDTKHPLYFLLVAGVINAVLNLFFVIVCHLDVAGVAIATVISQCISAVLVLLCLVRAEGPYRVDLRKLRIHGRRALQIVRVGLPAGIQGAIFSISNVLIQSSVNSFGSVAMAGNSASNNLEGFIYTSMNAVYQTSLNFTSQNLGAGKRERLTPILLRCLGIVTAVGAGMGLVFYLLRFPLLGIYSEDAEVVQFGTLRLTIFCATYFTCGIMDTCCGSIRGLGYSVLPTIVSLTGACGLRVLWIFTIFAANRSLTVLYLSYPVSWVITALAHLICYIVILRRKGDSIGRPPQGKAAPAQS